MSSSESSKVKDLVEGAEQLLNGHEELVRLLPTGSKALAAYKWAKRRRMVRFLQVIDYEVARNGEEARQRLDKLLTSEEGAEILSDFADAAVRTASRTVGAALAILYTDADNASYSPELKAQACVALDGLSDRAVTMLLYLTEVQESDRAPDGDAEAPAYFFDAVRARKPEINNLAPSLVAQIALIDDLQSRGLLFREHTTRWGGAGSSGVTYIIGEFSVAVRRLLLRAQGVLPEILPIEDDSG